MTRAHLKALRSEVEGASDRRARAIHFEVYGADTTMPLEAVRRSVIEAIDELLEMPTKLKGENTMAKRSAKKVEAKVEPANEPVAAKPLAVLDEVYDGEKCCKPAVDYTAQLGGVIAALEALVKVTEAEVAELNQLRIEVGGLRRELRERAQDVPAKVPPGLRERVAADVKAALEARQPEAKPEPAPEPPKPVTLDDVRKALLAHVQAKGHEATVAILAQFNVQRASDLKPEQYAAAKEALT